MKHLIFLVVLSLLIYSTNCKKKVGKKKEMEKYEAIQNICDSEEEERVLFCFCTPNDMNAAEEVVCWVHQAKISGDDPIWESFATQPKVEKLKFNIRPQGTLLNIPTKALNKLHHLKYLEIQYGYINELPPYVFSNLSYITDISIPQNQITNLQAYSIANLPMLTTMNLDGNKISEIKRDSIRDVPSLKKLFLNRNNLSIIHDYAFEHLHKVEELELNDNQISVITRETFSGLKSLRYLDLRKNRLTMIGDGTFQELRNLNELDLDENNLEYISEQGFSGLEKLTKLRLSENHLKTIGNVFRGMPNIFLLDLRSNGMESLTYETLEPLWNNLKNVTSHIGLEKNRFKCDCHITWIHNLWNDTENMEMKANLEELTCVTGPEMESSSFTLGTEKPPEGQTYNVDVNSLQYDDEDVEYEDDLYSSEDDNKSGKPPRKKIFDIPVETLPCPEMQKATTEMAAKSSVVYWQEASQSNPNSCLRIQFQLIPLITGFLGIYLFR